MNKKTNKDIKENMDICEENDLEEERYIDFGYTYQQLITLSFIENEILKHFSKGYITFLFEDIDRIAEILFMDFINKTLCDDLTENDVIKIRQRIIRIYEIHRYLYNKMMDMTKLYVQHPIKGYYHDYILKNIIINAIENDTIDDSMIKESIFKMLNIEESNADKKN